MNDYSFGNRLLALRTRCGLTQTALGGRLGVSGKAVSKWENGRAKPTTDTLRRLAALFQVDVDELLSLRDGESAKTSAGWRATRTASAWRSYRPISRARTARRCVSASAGWAGATSTARRPSGA